MYEFIPIGDTFEHQSGEGCWCSPEWSEDLEDSFESEVLIHNSHDRREDYETGKRLPH